MTGKKSAENFDQRRPESLLEQTLHIGDSKLGQNMGISIRRIEENNDYRIQLDLDRTTVTRRENVYIFHRKK